jgi:hypothetical protein
MAQFEVGKLYNPNKQRWLEASQYSFRGGQHELVLFFSNPTPQEVEAVRRGTAEFALDVELPLIVLCYRFCDGIPWSDAPYTYHVLSEHERGLPPETDGSTIRALLLVFLVDAETGILLAMRQVTLSPEFTTRLHEAIREQALLPWDRAEYDRALAELYRTRSTSVLVKTASVRCVGGA